MNRKTLLPGLLVLVLLTSACERPTTHTERLLAFGTIVEVSIHTADSSLVRTAMDAVEDDLAYMHRAWHPWEPGALGRTNQLLALEGNFSANPSVIPLLHMAKELERRSDGLFNPAMGELMELWGFLSDERGDAPPPSDTAINAWLEQRPSFEHVEIDGIRVRANRPGIRLDPGGFVKGYAVDRAMEHLIKLGVENAIINAGGDLRAIGRPGNRPWRIGIRHPDGESVIASLELSGDESVYTSGDYERYFDYDGERYHHILDPRTGRPADGARSVTVVHTDGTLADAASTALFVAGPERFAEIAVRMGIDTAMLIDPNGDVHLTPAMAARIRFETDPAPTLHRIELRP